MASGSKSLEQGTKILNLIKGRLSDLNSMMAIVMQDYNQHPVHARVKRGLVDLFGYGARALIGTAMDEDVQDLRQRYSHLLSIAETNHKFVNLNHNLIHSLRENVQELLKYSNKLHTVINDFGVRLDRLSELMVLDQAVTILKIRINNMITQKRILIANLLDTSDGRVTNSLLPITDW